jgi:hypothetical protein
MIAGWKIPLRHNEDLRDVKIFQFYKMLYLSQIIF